MQNSELELGFVVDKSHKTYFDEASGARGYSKPRLRCSLCRKTGLGLKFACKKAGKTNTTNQSPIDTETPAQQASAAVA